MYIADGSKTTYSGSEHPSNYTWGWLGHEVTSKGWLPDERKQACINRLKQHSKNAVCFHRGFHKCELCGKASFNGSVEIRHNGMVFVSPNGAEHYIEAHDYFPGNSVVEAILNGDSAEAVKEQGLRIQAMRDSIENTRAIRKEEPNPPGHLTRANQVSLFRRIQSAFRRSR